MDQNKQQSPSELNPSNQQSKTPQFIKQKHNTFLRNLDKTEDPQAIGFFMNEHLRLPGAYWCLTALSTMNMLTPETSRKQQILPFILACQDLQSGGFGGNIHHDPHMTSTHYAILVLSLYSAIDQIDKDLVAKYIAHLQNQDGSFKGDQWGECDTRFSYCALSCLTLLDKRDVIDVDKAVNYVLRCRNMDGGFGGVPGAESHAAYTFCGVGSLAIADKMKYIDRDELGHWLMNRQTLKGGFNGRPEKLADVCYSWWVLASCKMIERENWINLKELQKFVLTCQDMEDGGISDRPGNEPDVFHTFFGVAALSIIERATKKDESSSSYGIKLVDPIYALPISVMESQFKHVKICQ